jgi:Fe-S cluster assembly protein SufD
MMTLPTRYRPESAHGFLQNPTDGAQWRSEALAQLKARGIPSPKLERWRYTNLAGFEKANAVPAQKPELSFNPITLPWMVQNSRKLVFANGYLVFGDARLTLGGHLLEVPYDADPMEKFNDGMLWALNTAFMQDGPYLNLHEDATIEIIHVGLGHDHPQLASPRTVIEIAAGLNATIIEQYIADGAGVVHTNAALEIEVAANANLKHIRIQDEGYTRTILSSTHARIARGATYEHSFLNIGGALSRQEFWMELLEEGAHAAVKGAQLVTGRQHMDTTVLIEHAAANCTSNQTIRNVLAGDAVGVFQGKIHVHKIAQKTDGYQLCNTVMLSDRASMNTKPELEIYADDVKCSHGNTVGALDDAPLFYLRSRGIPEAEARRMMLTAFIGDLFDALDDNIKDALNKRVAQWLDHGIV